MKGYNSYKKSKGKKKKNSGVSQYLSVIALNKNYLTTPIKRHRLVGALSKKRKSDVFFQSKYAYSPKRIDQTSKGEKQYSRQDPEAIRGSNFILNVDIKIRLIKRADKIL